MKFRYHRGSLANSMATEVEISGTEAELRQLFLDDLPFDWARDYPVGAITWRRYSEDGDPRVGWKELWIIREDGSPFGWTDGEPRAADLHGSTGQ